MTPLDAEISPPAAADAETVLLLRAGHAPAFAAVMRRNNQRLYRLARGIVRDDAEAEEIVQEGYLRASSKIDGFDGRSSLATWLARIVLNEALGRLRGRRSTIGIDEVAELLPAAGGAAAGLDDDASPERAIARNEVRRAIERAVDRLPAPFRAVFILRAVEEMSIAETAACLGIPCDTVKTRLHRANKLLRRSLSDEFGSLLDGAFPFLGARCDGMVRRVLQRLGLPPVSP
jgi:RNA polymerase sigma-70 factor (ECF subfamily)